MRPPHALRIRAIACAALAAALLVIAPAAQAAIPLTPSFATESNVTNDMRGITVATAGDVNGDGYSDIIVTDDGPTSATGGVTVFLGGASGNPFDVSRIAFQKLDFSGFGPRAAGVGDVNGDGYDDICVCFANNIRIYYGRQSGIDAVNFTSTTITTYVPVLSPIYPQPAGDVNGDGFADFLVGFPESSCNGSNSGAVTLFFGRTGTVSFATQTTVCGAFPNDHFGTSCGAAGDVNADGYADVIIGAPNANLTGRAYVYLGSAGTISDGNRVILNGDENSSSYGGAVNGAGDVNGDGFADVIVGAQDHDYTPGGLTNCGEALVYLGNASGVSTTSQWNEFGSFSNAAFGASVATAGDPDGDGYADVIVGAPKWTNGQSNEGAFAIFDGSGAGILLSSALHELNSVGANYGNTVACAGDVNGDGFGDVLVAAPVFTNGQSAEGVVHLFLGSADNPGATTFNISYGTLNNQGYAKTLGTGGDFNGDGWPDMVVGDPDYTTASGDIGRASLLLGGPTGLSSTAAATYSPTALAAAGASVNLEGDINGDGLADAVIGLPSNAATGGAVIIFYGNVGAKFLGTTGRVPTVLVPTSTGTRFGAKVAVGDVNGDGYSDILVSAPDYSGGQGLVYLFLSPGAAGFANLAPANAFFTNTNPGSHYGAALAVIGDADRDGYLDFAVGAPDLVDGSLNPIGSVYVYRGQAGVPSTSPAATFPGDPSFPHFGTLVAGLGDIDGDGYSDFAFTATNLGGIAVLEGAPGLAFHGMVISSPSGSTFGASIAGIGDVNGDGMSDFVVGEPGATSTLAGEGRTYLYSSISDLADPIWFVSGGQAGAGLGGAVAGADFNQDGFADIAMSAPAYDLTGVGLTDCGRLSVFAGNGYGLYRGVQQRVIASNNPISGFGSSGSNTNFRVLGLGRMAGGRTKVRMEVRGERMMYASAAFSGLTGISDTGPGGLFYGSSVSLVNDVTNLTPGATYAWSARYRSRSLWFPTSPWLSPGNNGGPRVYDFRTTGTSLAVDATAPVNALELASPYPNPVRGTMRIAYALPRAGEMTVEVTDLQGRRVRTLANGMREAGHYEATWDGSDAAGGKAAPGVYFVRLSSGGERTSRRIIRLE